MNQTLNRLRDQLSEATRRTPAVQEYHRLMNDKAKLTNSSGHNGRSYTSVVDSTLKNIQSADTPERRKAALAAVKLFREHAENEVSWRAYPEGLRDRFRSYLAHAQRYLDVIDHHPSKLRGLRDRIEQTDSARLSDWSAMGLADADWTWLESLAIEESFGEDLIDQLRLREQELNRRAGAVLAKLAAGQTPPSRSGPIDFDDHRRESIPVITDIELPTT